MRIIQNNAQQPPAERFVWCTVCNSKLAITNADIKRVEGTNAVYCPCCHSLSPS